MKRPKEEEENEEQEQSSRPKKARGQTTITNGGRERYDDSQRKPKRKKTKLTAYGPCRLWIIDPGAMDYVQLSVIRRSSPSATSMDCVAVAIEHSEHCKKSNTMAQSIPKKQKTEHKGMVKRKGESFVLVVCFWWN